MAIRNWTDERFNLLGVQDRARARISTLEADLGIREAAQRASEGSFLPVGMTNPEFSDETASDWEYDDRRRGIRGLYFKVADVEGRKALMAAQVELRRAIDDMHAVRLSKARASLASARRKFAILPWVYGAIVGVMSVYYGQQRYGQAGIVGGGVAGLFLGFGASAWTRSEGEGEISLAQSDVTDAEKDIAEFARLPPYFTESEAATGEPDAGFDAQSAMGNRARG